MFVSIFRNSNQCNLHRIGRFSMNKQSVREIRDNNKIGWSRTKKRMIWICLGGIALKFYSLYY